VPRRHAPAAALPRLLPLLLRRTRRLCERNARCRLRPGERCMHTRRSALAALPAPPPVHRPCLKTLPQRAWRCCVPWPQPSEVRACTHAPCTARALALTPLCARSVAAERTDASRRAALSAVAELERCVGVPAPTASPLLDGRWSLVWTCSAGDAGAPGRSGDDDGDALGLRAALQAASDAAYKFFYARVPFIVRGALRFRVRAAVCAH
jgi:hypothetical protein